MLLNFKTDRTSMRLMKLLAMLLQAEVTVAKFQNRVHVYTVEGGLPMFFDVDGRGSEIYPSGTKYSILILLTLK